MIDIDEYDFGNTTSLIDNNNDEDYYKDYLEEMETDYWVEEYKNNSDLI